MTERLSEIDSLKEYPTKEKSDQQLFNIRDLADSTGRRAAIERIVRADLHADYNPLAERSVINTHAIGEFQKAVEKAFKEGGENAVEKFLSNRDNVQPLISKIAREAALVINTPKFGH